MAAGIAGMLGDSCFSCLTCHCKSWLHTIFPALDMRMLQAGIRNVIDYWQALQSAVGKQRAEIDEIAHHKVPGAWTAGMSYCQSRHFPGRTSWKMLSPLEQGISGLGSV